MSTVITVIKRAINCLYMYSEGGSGLGDLYTTK